MKKKKIKKEKRFNRIALAIALPLQLLLSLLFM